VIYLNHGDRKLVILEPGNLERLRAGRLAIVPDDSVAIAFCPDHVWPQEEIFKIGADKLTVEDIVRLLKEGQTRADVTERPYHPTFDAMKKGGTA
jgi:hypothetical protein